MPPMQPAAAMKSAEMLPALKRQKKRKLPEKAASDRVCCWHPYCSVNPCCFQILFLNKSCTIDSYR